jgi:hypothetical protein
VVFDYLDHLEESASLLSGIDIGKVVKSNGSSPDTIRHAHSIITVTQSFLFLREMGVKDITVIQRRDTKALMPAWRRQNSWADWFGLGYVGS